MSLPRTERARGHGQLLSRRLCLLVARMAAHGYSTTEFDIPEERRAALAEAGRGAMRRHLEKTALQATRWAAEGEAVQREVTRLATRFLEKAK